MIPLLAFLNVTGTLHAKGAQIQDADGKPFLFAGVTISDFESDPVDKSVLRKVKSAFQDWKSNAIRLQLNQDAWFGKDGQSDEGKAYRKIVDDTIQTAKEFSGYVILDLAITDTGTWGRNIGSHEMPDANSLTFWKDVAKTYKKDPGVVFELFDAPGPKDERRWKEGGSEIQFNSEGHITVGYSGVGHQNLVRIIRAQEASNLIIADVPDRGNDLEIALQYPIIDPVDHELAYGCSFDPSAEPFGEFSKRIYYGKNALPVIVTNFGLNENTVIFDSPQWRAQKAIETLQANDLGWIASPQAINSVGQPQSAFGRSVKRCLTSETLAPIEEPPKPSSSIVLYDRGPSPYWTLVGPRGEDMMVSDGQSIFTRFDAEKQRHIRFSRPWVPLRWLDKIHCDIMTTSNVDMWVSFHGTEMPGGNKLITGIQPGRWNSIWMARIKS